MITVSLAYSAIDILSYSTVVLYIGIMEVRDFLP